MYVGTYIIYRVLHEQHLNNEYSRLTTKGLFSVQKLRLHRDSVTRFFFHVPKEASWAGEYGARTNCITFGL